MRRRGRLEALSKRGKCLFTEDVGVKGLDTRLLSSAQCRPVQATRSSAWAPRRWTGQPHAGGQRGEMVGKALLP